MSGRITPPCCWFSSHDYSRQEVLTRNFRHFQLGKKLSAPSELGNSEFSEWCHTNMAARVSELNEVALQTFKGACTYISLLELHSWVLRGGEYTSLITFNRLRWARGHPRLYALSKESCRFYSPHQRLNTEVWFSRDLPVNLTGFISCSRMCMKTTNTTPTVDVNTVNILHTCGLTRA